MWMNRYEVSETAERVDATEFPNVAQVAQTVENLMHWADENSDGWTYWPKPSRAASKAMEMLDAHEKAERRGWTPQDGDVEDITDADMRKVLSPIKAFLTRQGVEHKNVLVAA